MELEGSGAELQASGADLEASVAELQASEARLKASGTRLEASDQTNTLEFFISQSIGRPSDGLIRGGCNC